MDVQSPPLHVLVVDDEPLIRWSIAETLAQGGHTVLEAGSARAATETIAMNSDPIDVVLLDYRLPDSDDLGLLQDIRRMRPETAVVMMTAYGSPETMKAALESGAYSVVNKPFDMHSLESLVREAHIAPRRH
jgi:DNA-binding NtrC family response regulator